MEWGDDLADQQSEHFATEENVLSSVKFVLQSLTGLGMPASSLDLFSGKPADVAAVVNLLHQLLKQRQQDRETREQLEDLTRKLRVDVQVAQRERNRLEDKLQEQHTANGNLEIKIRQAQKASKEANSGATSRQDHDAKRIRQLSAAATQAETALKRRELEVEQLRARLTQALSSSSFSCSSAAAAAAAASGPAGGGVAAAQAGPSVSCEEQLVAARVGAQRVRAQPSMLRLSATTLTSQQQQQELVHAKKQAEARCATLAEENARLEARASDMQRDLTRLLARCEAMGLGVASSDAASVQQLGGKEAAGCVAGSQQAPPPQQDLSQHHHLLATDLKVVQDRASALLSRWQQQQAPGSGASRQELDAALRLVRDQGKAISRALVSIGRAEAQRDAAQQRAAAAHQQALALEQLLAQARREADTLALQLRLVQQQQQPQQPQPRAHNEPTQWHQQRPPRDGQQDHSLAAQASFSDCGFLTPQQDWAWEGGAHMPAGPSGGSLTLQLAPARQAPVGNDAGALAEAQHRSDQQQQEHMGAASRPRSSSTPPARARWALPTRGVRPSPRELLLLNATDANAWPA